MFIDHLGGCSGQLGGLRSRKLAKPVLVDFRLAKLTTYMRLRAHKYTRIASAQSHVDGLSLSGLFKETLPVSVWPNLN